MKALRNQTFVRIMESLQESTPEQEYYQIRLERQVLPLLPMKKIRGLTYDTDGLANWLKNERYKTAPRWELECVTAALCILGADKGPLSADTMMRKLKPKDLGFGAKPRTWFLALNRANELFEKEKS